MIILWVIIESLLATLLFDFDYSTIEDERDVEKSWQAFNEMLEREGRRRLDQMYRADEGK